MLVYIILSLLIFSLLPTEAHAWGPGTHIEIALSLLEKLALAAPAIRAVVAGRQDWFLYGSIAADIIVGKKYAGPLHHCHNWKVARRILAGSRTDRERAAAYGYLAHLAADMVGHNYYIPYKIMESYKIRFLKHTYWEAMFDVHVRPVVWDEIKKMALGDFGPFDKHLEAELKSVLFSFDTSKKILSSILLLQRFKYFRRYFKLYHSRSKWGLTADEVKHFLTLANDVAMGFMANPDHAPCLAGDPSGGTKIKYANLVRKRLKKLARRGDLNKKAVTSFLSQVKDYLRETMFDANARPPEL